MCKPKCRVCGFPFDENPDDSMPRQSLKNAKWLAELDADGNVIAETCETCAQEIEEDLEDEYSVYDDADYYWSP